MGLWRGSKISGHYHRHISIETTLSYRHFIMRTRKLESESLQRQILLISQAFSSILCSFSRWIHQNYTFFHIPIIIRYSIGVSSRDFYETHWVKSFIIMSLSTRLLSTEISFLRFYRVSSMLKMASFCDNFIRWDVKILFADLTW